MIVNGYKIESNADLEGANLRGTGLKGADLQGAILRRAYLREADLWRANLRGADLSGADIQMANLREADLRRAYLFSAYLWGTDLARANLQQARLQDARLLHTYLRGADLRGADLRNADLRRTDLRWTKLDGADLRGTCLDPANIPNGEADEFERDADPEWVVGYRTVHSPWVRSNIRYTRGIYKAPWFSTADDTECHPGLYLCPTKDEVEAEHPKAIIIRVLTRPEAIHKAGRKYRCKWFVVEESLEWDD